MTVDASFISPREHLIIKTSDRDEHLHFPHLTKCLVSAESSGENNNNINAADNIILNIPNKVDSGQCGKVPYEALNKTLPPVSLASIISGFFFAVNKAFNHTKWLRGQPYQISAFLCVMKGEPGWISTSHRPRGPAWWPGREDSSSLTSLLSGQPSLQEQCMTAEPSLLQSVHSHNDTMTNRLSKALWAAVETPSVAPQL